MKTLFPLVLLLLLPLASSVSGQGWMWEGGGPTATRNMGSSGIGSGEHLWMRQIEARAMPTTEQARQWRTVDTFGPAADSKAVYGLVAKKDLRQHTSPWGWMEARHATTGKMLWNTTIPDLPAGGPILIGGHLYLLVGSPPRGLSNAILELDAANGRILKRIEIAPGGSKLSGADGTLYVASRTRDDSGRWTGGHVSKIAAETGEIVWTQAIAATAWSAPLILPDHIVVPTLGGLAALDPNDGQLQWLVPGLPSLSPIFEGGKVYSVFLENLGSSFTLKQVDATLGAVSWSRHLWSSFDEPCQIQFVDGRLIVHGLEGEDPLDDASMLHVTALDPETGGQVWDSKRKAMGVSCHAPVSPKALFVSGNDGNEEEVTWAIALSNGEILWISPYALQDAVLVNDVLVGFGQVFALHVIGWPRMMFGWIALDAGIGKPRLPVANFTEESLPRWQAPLIFRDQSTAGSFPIVARLWELSDEEGAFGGTENTRDLELWFNYGEVNRTTVTLTVMDSEYHISSISRTYDVLPEAPDARGSVSPSFGLACLLAIVSAAFQRRRKGRPSRWGAEPSRET